MKRTALNIIDQGSPVAAASHPITVHGESRKHSSCHTAMRVAVVTLGCAKNQVDSEVMLGVLKERGYALVSDLGEAEVVVVNTCSFLESSVNESIDCILDVASYRDKGVLKKLIVGGCLVERYGERLRQELPEVDGFIKVDQLEQVADLLDGSLPDTVVQSAAPTYLYSEKSPRVLTTPRHTAYVKISDGCNRGCSFCIIPKLRGSLRSRSAASLQREVADLAEKGVREVNLIAQDLTAYGSEQNGANLAELLRLLAATDISWIRLLYAYPSGVNGELLSTIRELPKVCDYLDIPLQHVSTKVLKGMCRPLGRFSPRRLVEMVRAEYPEIALRTTFIVGFPGESEGDFRELEEFVKEGHFLSVGVFTYSHEEGTAAYSMNDAVSQMVKEERRSRLMEAQAGVVAPRLKAFVGKTLPVLVEGLHEESELLLSGRCTFQAPEVDGAVIINDIFCSDESKREGVLMEMPGSIAPVEITDVAGYDLVGRVKG